MTTTILLTILAASSWFMVGLIWFVQRVHYPLFAEVAEAKFLVYHQQHVTRTSMVVIPPMVLELVACLGLLLWPGELSRWLICVSALLLAGVWMSTICLQIPLHQSLGERCDPMTIRRLVRTNWWRTVLWSVQAVWVSTLLVWSV